MGRMPVSLRWALTIALLSALLLLSACSDTPSATFEPDGGTYDEAGVEQLLDDIGIGDFAELTTEDSPDVRREVLVDLRTHGDDASAAADLLMTGFPERTTSVPVLVEAAEFEGVESWIVVEVWGDQGGTLDHKRVWVFDRETGSLIWSASRQ